MELREKAIKGLAWSSVQIWGGRAVSFVVFVILLRILNPEAFGLVAMASVFIAFTQIILVQGFGDAIIQRKQLTPEHLDTAFWINTLSGGVLTLVGIVAAGLFAGLFHEPRLIPIIRWLSFSFIFVGLSSTQQAILRRRLAFKELALRSLVATVSGGIVGVVLAFMGYGVWSLVAQSLVSALIGAMVLWKVSQWRPTFRFSKTHFKDLYRFGLNIVGIKFLGFLNRHVDDLLIGYFLGPTMLGFYTVAYRLLLTMTDLLTSVTNSVAFPVFSRLQNEPERMRRAFYQVTQFTSMISFPVFVGVAVIAPELLVTVFGPQWTLSIPVMQVLAFIGILHSIFYFHTSAVIAAGKPSWRLGMSLVNAISNVIAFAVAVHWGIVAVAAAYVIRGYLLSPLEIWIIRKLIQINVRAYLRQYRGPVVGSLVMVLTIGGLKYLLAGALSVQLRLAVYLLAGGLVYLLVIQWLVPSLWQRVINHLRLVWPRRAAGISLSPSDEGMIAPPSRRQPETSSYRYYIVATHSFLVTVELDANWRVCRHKILDTEHHYGTTFADSSKVLSIKRRENKLDQPELTTYRKNGSCVLTKMSSTPLSEAFGDIHQIAYANEGLYLTNTLHNSLVFERFDGHGRHEYFFGGVTHDVNHPNSVYPCGDQIFVLLHNSGQDSEVAILHHDLSKGFTLRKQVSLWHKGCHNLYVDGHRLYYNASAAGEFVIVDLNRERVAKKFHFSGHVKGLSATPDYFVIGVSEHAERQERFTTKGYLATIDRRSLSVDAMVDINFDSLSHPIGNINEIRCTSTEELAQSGPRLNSVDWSSLRLSHGDRLYRARIKARASAHSVKQWMMGLINRE